MNLSFGSTVFEEQEDISDPIERGVTGYASRWQCWNGEDWVDTHLLVHNGEAIAGQPGATTTMPGIALAIPNSYTIVIPAVPPGWYRIKTRTVGPEPISTGAAERVGYSAVEVIE